MPNEPPPKPSPRSSPARRGQFAPGRSGNPGGRPKVVAEVRDLAIQNAPAALEELVKLSTGSPDHRVRVAACNAVLDRAVGKPEANKPNAGAGDALLAALTAMAHPTPEQAAVAAAIKQAALVRIAARTINHQTIAIDRK